MATSKTLAPTGVTIQIPEFTDQPDQRVNSNCIDKEADAINALNNNITTLTNAKVLYGTFSTDNTAQIDLSKYNYIVLNASIDNNVVIPYTSPSYNNWLIRKIDNTAFVSQTGITVAYIKKY